MTGETTSLFRRILGWATSFAPTKVMHIRVIAFQEGDVWCAQCLEHDIAVQAIDIPNLRDALKQAFIDQIQISLDLGVEPFSNIPPAPQAFYRIYDRAAKDNSRVQEKLDVKSGTGPVVHPELRLFTGQARPLAGAMC